MHFHTPYSEKLDRIAERQYHRSITVDSYRGSILDRRGQPLAISIKKTSLFVNPRIFHPTSSEIKDLSKILSIRSSRIISISKKSSYFAWLKRKLDSQLSKKILDKNIAGIFAISEPARYYPQGDLIAHTVGISGTDNIGLTGIEKSYNNYLKGDKSQVTRQSDAKGRPIFVSAANARPEKAGNSIYLTIDLALQEIAAKALQRGVAKAKSKAGYVIVSDPYTGRILAQSNYPSFNPNNLNTLNSENRRNRGFSDLIEPGSVVKPILVSRALEMNAVSLHEEIFCFNGLYKGNKWRISDAHPHATLSVQEIVSKSSNIGTYLIAQKMGPRIVHQTYKDNGFGSDMQRLDIPGQAVGRLTHWKKWSEHRFSNIAFGQGFVTSALDIVGAYNAIANGGKLMQPLIIDHIKSADNSIAKSFHPKIIHQVMTPETSEQMRRILQYTVDQGTGKNAKLNNYTSGGKTGTSEKVDPDTKAYSDNLRIASFVGFAPATDPHLVIYVVIDEPTNKPYFGGTWAAPVFKEIAEKGLKYLNVSPDKNLSSSQADLKGVLDHIHINL